MTDTPDQLNEIHQQLRMAFDHHPFIHVSPLRGNPPSQYEIVYHLNALHSTEKKEPELASEHRIELTIPFGFPHFPPSCKPKSAVFHPDFDPDVVRISDIWEKNNDLTKLIIHIGQMLNGEHYSSEQSFNEAAATWYGENADLFPISAIDWSAAQSQTASSDEVAVNDLAFSLSTEIAELESDTLEDVDFEEEFDYLTLDNLDISSEARADQTKKNPENKAELPAELDLDLLNHLYREKRFFRVIEITNGKTDSLPPPIIELVESARTTIETGRQTYERGYQLDAEGKPFEALSVFLQLRNSIADYPNIEKDIRRARQAHELLCAENKGVRSDLAIDQDMDLLEGMENPHPTPPQDSGPERTFYHKTYKPRRKPLHSTRQVAQQIDTRLRRYHVGLPFVIIVAILLFGGGGYSLLLYMRLNVLAAETSYNLCEAQMSRGHFEEARDACRNGAELLHVSNLLHYPDSKRLSQAIIALETSETMQQGLQGKILVDGQYIHRDKIALLNDVQGIVARGQEMSNAEDWQGSVMLYSNFLKTHEKVLNKSPELRAMLTQPLSIAEFHLAYERVERLIDERKWDEALKQLPQAQSMVQRLDEQARTDYSNRLLHLSSLCQFEAKRDQADLLFSDADWLQAIGAYKAALVTAEKLQLPSGSGYEDIQLRLKRAELYTTIDQGNKAFADGNWTEAAKAYQKADEELVAHPDILNSTDLITTRNKLGRIRLQAILINKLQQTHKLRDENRLVEAQTAYRQLVRLLDDNGLKNDKEFAEMRAGFIAAIDEISDEQHITQQENYLKSKYKELFTAHYPAAEANDLSTPVVTFLNRTTTTITYKMQCLDHSHPRPMTLVMYYGFDKATKSWSLQPEPE